MDLLTRVVLGNPVYMYLVSVAIVLSSFGLGRLFQIYGRTRLRAWAQRTRSHWDDLLAGLLGTPLTLFVTILGVTIAVSILELPHSMQHTLQRILVCITTVVVLVALTRLARQVFDNVVLRRVEMTPSKVDDQVAFLVHKMVLIVIWSFGLLIVLTNLGLNVVSLLTGLGLGGLAVAMAAKDTLANIIGGITILLDRPIALGDLVKIDNVEGKVEEIGIRTTRVRTVEGHLVSIPNSRAADSVLENVSARLFLRVRFTLGLSYDTPAEKLLEVESLIRETIQAVEGVSREQEVSAHLLEFASSSLNFQVVYHIADADSAFAIRHAVNTGILRMLASEGLTIPFNTYTILQPQEA